MSEFFDRFARLFKNLNLTVIIQRRLAAPKYALRAGSYVHGRKAMFAGFNVYGYACVPPTPFLLKDWERYDVSRYVDPGCISPEEGRRSVAVEESDVKWRTIAKDLDSLVNDDSVDRAIFLFHTRPYDTRWIVLPLTERCMSTSHWTCTSGASR